MDNITVEVIYALPNEQKLLSLQVKKGSNVADAIKESKIINEYPEIDINKNKIGIFSRIVDLKHILRHKDRIEIYRPLIADPKKMRRDKLKK